MFDAMSASLKIIITRPKALFPVFLAMLASVGFSILFMLTTLDIIYDIIVWEGIIHQSLTEAVFFLFRESLSNIAILFAVFLASFWLMTIIGIYYCRYSAQYSKRKEKVSEALSFAAKSCLNSLAFIIIAGMFFSAAIAGIFLIAMIPLQNIWFYLAVLMVYFIIVLIVSIRLFLFSLPALAVKKTNAKKAVHNAWLFSGKRFWQSIIFAFIFTLLASLTTTMQTLALGDIYEILLVAPVFAIFNTLFSAFALGAIAIYYSEKSN